jgi:DNA-binding response OmpR family regulator
MILIVHDHATIAHVIGHVLTRAEVVSVHVTTCHEAQEALRTQEWRGVIFGLHLPDGTALDVLHWLHHLPDHMHTPVFVLTEDMLLDDHTTIAVARAGAHLHVGVLTHLDILNICRWLLMAEPREMTR